MMKKCLYASILAAAVTGLPGLALADVTIPLGDFDFEPGESVALPYELVGALTGWDVSFDYLGNTDGSWSADALFGVIGANGNGVEIGGYDVTFGLDYLGGVGAASGSPGSFIENYPALGGSDVGGAGFWTLLVGDGWSDGSQLSSYHNVVFTLYGVNLIPAPGVLALLGVAGLVGVRRRRA